MKITATLVLLASAILNTAAPAEAQTLRAFASSVPQAADWSRAARAEGQPPNLDCDQSSPDYAFNDAGMGWLVADEFDPLGLASHQLVDQVRVGVLARFDMNEPADIRVRVSWTRDAGTANPSPQQQPTTFALSNGTGDGDCSWQTWDITALESVWTSAELESLRIEVRRRNSYPNNRLRVKGFRVVVEPVDCIIAQGCAALPNATGVPTALAVTGTPSLSGSVSTLVTSGPPNQFGLYWWGNDTAPVASGRGLLCIGSPQRINNIVALGGNGTSSTSLNLGSPDFSTVQVGSTIALQFQHRDPQGASSMRWNWSNSVLLTLCP